MAAPTVTLRRTRLPRFVSVPEPVTVLASAVKTPVAPTTIAPFTVRVREDSDSVCAPELPPRRMVEPVKVVSRTTVYVPGSTMATDSAGSGTVPLLQFAALLQLPPAGLVHWLTEAAKLTSNAVLMTPGSAAPEAESV